MKREELLMKSAGISVNMLALACMHKLQVNALHALQRG